MSAKRVAAALNVRDVCLQFLRSVGIDTIFGNPGSTELPLFRNFPDDFRYVLGLQECVVVGMADGYAQATRRAAFVNLHSAAGVGHALGNIFTAFKNQTPLIVTAGQQARSILPYDPFLFAAEATQFPKPYVKYSCEPARAQDAPLALARAWRIAMTPPRGPVFLSIPADDWDRPAMLLPARETAQKIGPDPQLLARFAQALNGARKPAFVIGGGVDRDGAVSDVVALAEAHSAAVFVAPMTPRCGFPEDHPLFQGFLPAMREKIATQLAGHDLILVLGAPAFTYHIEGDGPHIPQGARLLQIVDDPQLIAWAPEGDGLLASLDVATHKLLALSQAAPRARPAPRPQRAPAAPDDPMTTAFALQCLDSARAPEDVVVEEAPGARGVMQANLPMPGADSFYTMASGGLGWGLPAAVGVALGRQKLGLKGRTIALIGDGSAMYAIQALHAAAQTQAPVTFIILNNARYAALQDFAPVFGYGAQEKPVGTDLAGLDFVALAKGHGLAARRVETAAALPAALRAGLRKKEPNLIDIVVT